VGLTATLRINDIFGNPIYERLIGFYDSVNSKFDGKFELVVNDLKNMFGIKYVV